jgi:hypothetical protein
MTGQGWKPGEFLALDLDEAVLAVVASDLFEHWTMAGIDLMELFANEIGEVRRVAGQTQEPPVE